MTESLDQIAFGQALLLSDRRPQYLDERIEWRPIEPLNSRADYSAFMLHKLHEHVETSHVLCVQWDGYVLDGSRWRDEFMTFDYIGAVWPHFTDGHNVGNGGFSLRSQNLLRATATLDFDPRYPEDVLICRKDRAALEEMGFRFAPETIAAKFAFERSPSSGEEFGFHGAFNMIRLLRPEDLANIVRSLELQVLTQNEHKELLHRAVRKGYYRLAFFVMARFVRRQLSFS